MHLPRFRAASAVLVGTGFAAALMLGAAAVPAQAAGSLPGARVVTAAGEKRSDLYVNVVGRQMSAGAGGKYFAVEIGNRGRAPATDVKAAFDFTKIDPKFQSVATTVESGSCKGTECSLGTLAPGQVAVLQVAVSAVQGLLVEGSAGSFTVSVTPTQQDANPGDNTTTAALTVVKAGTDLRTWVGLWTPETGRSTTVKPGTTWKMPASILDQGSSGTRPEAVTFTLEVPASATIVERYADCTYQSDWYGGPRPAGTAYGPSTVTCTVPWLSQSRDLVIDGKKGELFSVQFGTNLDGPAFKDIHFSAQPAVLPKLPPCALSTPATCATVAGAMAEDLKVKLPTGPGSGTPARDIDPADNGLAYQIATTANPADLAVTAGKATGKVGDTVDVKIDVKNRGPADAPSWRAELTAPTGTKFVGTTDAWCGKASPAKPVSNLVCDHPALLPVSTGPYTAGVPFTAKVKILSANVGGDGLVAVSQPGTEKNAADNKARIQIEVPGVGNGGGGAAGGGPAGGGAAGGPAGGDAAPASGGLPVTGSQVALIATAGGIALLVGALLFVLTKRRRVALVTPDE
jgi:LPXTG-motif cell wall-anchored protein